MSKETKEEERAKIDFLIKALCRNGGWVLERKEMTLEEMRKKYPDR